MLVFWQIFLLEQSKSAMKGKRSSTEQIVAAMKQAELCLAVSDLIRQLGISEQTFYLWKK
jgi:putative transposase